MRQLLDESIPSAALAKADSDYVLMAYPNLVGRCRYFIINYNGKKKLLWLMDRYKGTDITAVMQSIVLEAPYLGAMVSFSTDGRRDGTKTIITIAYQLAVKLERYRLFIQDEVTRDPSLLRESLLVQFERLIIKPFIHRRLVDSRSRLVIIIHDLGICDNPYTTQELLNLISDFCITYPTSPLVWIVSSQSETHIKSFFSRSTVALAFVKEEVWIEAHQDIERFLRERFVEIKNASTQLRRQQQWPSDGDISKITEASGGLYAYTETVAKYIGDPSHGDPVGHLGGVLDIVETCSSVNISREYQPLAQLDALYTHILSKIPRQNKANTRRLLLLYTGETECSRLPFRLCSNMLGMSESAAYAAVRPIRAMVSDPTPEGAADTPLRPFHKSWVDHLRDFRRSGFSPDIMSEAKQLMGQCALRIIQEAPDGVQNGGVSENKFLSLGHGTLKNGPGAGDNISVSWPAVEEDNNRKIEIDMYHVAVLVVMNRLERGEEAFQSLLCLRVMTTCFDELPSYFPFDAFQDLIFVSCISFDSLM